MTSVSYTMAVLDPTDVLVGVFAVAIGLGAATAAIRRRDSSRSQPGSMAMDLRMAQDAAGYIRERGGRLYLWQEEIGNAWASDHMALDDPQIGVTFTPVRADGGIVLMLAEDLDPPRNVIVRLRRFPRGLQVEWDGRTWGWRGDVAGGG